MAVRGSVLKEIGYYTLFMGRVNTCLKIWVHHNVLMNRYEDMSGVSTKFLLNVTPGETENSL